MVAITLFSLAYTLSSGYIQPYQRRIRPLLPKFFFILLGRLPDAVVLFRTKSDTDLEDLDS